MEAYVMLMRTVRISRERSKAPDSALTHAEHRGLRTVVGHLQWAARMICFEEAFEASRLASTRGAPTVKDPQDGSAAIRRIQKRGDLLI
eukprot:7806074-Pyramimonas_sp.AAC.1